MISTAVNDPYSRNYSASQFEILATCLHPITQRWDFQYCLTRSLPLHRRCSEKLSDRVLVDGWSPAQEQVLAHAAYPRKSNSLGMLNGLSDRSVNLLER